MILASVSKSFIPVGNDHLLVLLCHKSLAYTL